MPSSQGCCILDCPSTEADLLRADNWTASVRAAYVRDGAVVASSRRMPVHMEMPPVGTWKMDNFRGLYGREVERLCLLDPSELLKSEDLVEHNIEGRGDDAERYAQWLREGLSPPPIQVVQIADGSGRFKVVDGHRRLAAHRAVGRMILAWVSPVVEHPHGTHDSEGRPLLVGFTLELAQARGQERVAA